MVEGLFNIYILEKYETLFAVGDAMVAAESEEEAENLLEEKLKKDPINSSLSLWSFKLYCPIKNSGFKADKKGVLFYSFTRGNHFLEP